MIAIAEVAQEIGLNVCASEKLGVDSGIVNGQPPVMSAPTEVDVVEGFAFSATAQATDPDAGDVLTISVTGQPADMPFSPVSGPSPLAATLAGTAAFGDAGLYQVRWTATDATGLTDLAITRLNVIRGNRSPVLNPVSNMTICDGATADQEISGSDADGDALTFAKISGPAFLTVTTLSPTTGNIHLAPPLLTLPGTTPATVRADDGRGGIAERSFTVTIPNCDRAPTLNQPANMTVRWAHTADQAISGSDPFGAPLTFIKVAGPNFMALSATGPTTANVHLAPSFGDVGTYTATVRVSSGSFSNEKNFTITVNNGSPPVLNPIANMTLPPGNTQDQAISGSDADGDLLTFSKTAGPAFMTVATTSPTAGNIHLAPPLGTSGTFGGTVTASDGFLTDSRSFAITICLGCIRPPVIDPIANMTVTEGMTADQTITATDPDGSPVTFSKVTGPIFMTVTTVSPGTGNATGNIHLAPGLADAGTYAATARATNGALASDRTFSITALTSGNRCPSANPGGPYTGAVGVPINFDGSGSSDPDGNPLTYAWDFDASDGLQVDAVGVMVSHAYAVDGLYTATLTVTDNGDGDPSQVCSDGTGTSVFINPACPAAIFNGYDTIRLGSGKPFWFAYVQSSTTCYVNSDVVIASFVMKYAGRQIFASGKTSVGGDKSGDGIQEIKINFSKDDLRTLFSGTGLPNGHNTVTVTLEAGLTNGGRLSGTTQIDVVNNGSFTAATVAPNPLNPEAILSYVTTRSGPVRIDLFNVQGQLVRRLVDDPMMTAGTHETTIDGRGSRGEKLPSDVYYIHGTSAEGEFKHLITILK